MFGVFNLEKRAHAQLLITLKPYLGHLSTCRLTCYPYPIIHPLAKVKSLAFLDHLLVVDYALKQGFDDAIVQDHQGMVLETSVANLFWRFGNDLFFPDPSLSLYQGITLQQVLIAAEKIGLNKVPVQARLEDIPADSQLYICNSLKGIVPVIEIDTKPFKRDLIFEQDLYKNLC